MRPLNPFSRRIALGAAALLWLVAPRTPLAEPAPAPPRAATLNDAVGELTRRVTALGGKLGVSIVDLSTGKQLAEVNAKLPLNPASNMKLLTAAVALDRLGPSRVFTTSLLGERSGTQVRELVVRGNGDPSLRITDLLRLALALRNGGVSQVGAILVDQSYFDAQFVPPAFEQQPNEWAPFRAPVSAIAIEGNTIALNVRPTTPGSPAHSWFEPEGIVSVQGQVMTQAKGSGERVGWTLTPDGSRLLAQLGGSIGSDLPRHRFRRRVHDPRLVPGYALKKLLSDLGVEVGDRVQEGGHKVGQRLVFHESMPLAILLGKLGKDSDNFAAEMLLKVLGAESTGAAGTSAAGSQAILRWLEERGALVPETRISNGSGLFDANRVSAWSFSQALRAVYLNPKLQAEYLAHLAIGGVDGTLENRFKALPPATVVRAKTGTLDATLALGGYALDERGAFAFSLIVDGVAGHHGELRTHLDRIVSLL